MITPVRGVFPEHADEEHEEDLGFCFEGMRELLEEEKDDARASQCEWEKWTVGEGFEE